MSVDKIIARSQSTSCRLVSRFYIRVVQGLLLQIGLENLCFTPSTFSKHVIVLYVKYFFCYFSRKVNIRLQSTSLKFGPVQFVPQNDAFSTNKCLLSYSSSARVKEPLCGHLTSIQYSPPFQKITEHPRLPKKQCTSVKKKHCIGE